MIVPPVPANEACRLAALRDADVLDTPPEPYFDHVTALAARLFEVKSALVSLVDTDRQWFKSRAGLDARETPREVSLCGHAILSDAPLVVLDARDDPRFSDNPLVAGDPNIRFYAGAPLITADGYRLGSLCIIDYQPRAAFSEPDRRTLADLAALVSAELDRRRTFERRVGEAAKARHLLQQHLQAAVEASPLALITVDCEGIVTGWNPAAETIFGWTANEAFGRFLPIAGKRYHGEWAAIRKRLRAGETVIGVEAQRLRKDGSLIDVAISAAPLSDLDGRYTGTLALVEDISDRKRIEREKEAAAKRLRRQNAALLAAARLPLSEGGDLDAMFDRLVGKTLDVLGAEHGGILIAGERNSRAVPQVYYLNGQRAALPARSFDAAAAPRYTAAIAEDRVLAAADLDDDPRLEEVAGLLKGYGVRALLHAPIRIGGRPQGVLCVGYGGGPRQWTPDEQAFAASMADLAALSIEASRRAKAMEEIKQAKEAAEAASRVKSRFLATMSHELRTPLNAIIGFSELIAKEVLGPVGHDNYRGYAGDIRASGRHLLAIVNQVLEMAASQSGADALDERETALDEILPDCTAAVEAQTQNAGIVFETAMPADPVTIMCDPVKLRQAVVNLLSNAIKFTARGGRVALAADLPAAGGLFIRVTDTGIGMPLEAIGLAMEPFVQLDDGLSRCYEGTGLGLPLAKSMIEAHDGTLTLNSAPGRGTEAQLYLPAERVHGYGRVSQGRRRSAVG